MGAVGEHIFGPFECEGSSEEFTEAANYLVSAMQEDAANNVAASAKFKRVKWIEYHALTETASSNGEGDASFDRRIVEFRRSFAPENYEINYMSAYFADDPGADYIENFFRNELGIAIGDFFDIPNSLSPSPRETPGESTEPKPFTYVERRACRDL